MLFFSHHIWFGVQTEVEYDLFCCGAADSAKKKWSRKHWHRVKDWFKDSNWGFNCSHQDLTIIIIIIQDNPQIWSRENYTNTNSTFTVRIYTRCIHLASVDPDVHACQFLMSWLTAWCLSALSLFCPERIQCKLTNEGSFTGGIVFPQLLKISPTLSTLLPSFWNLQFG